MKTDEGALSTLRVNLWRLDQTGEPRGWAFVGAHELMHTLGLADLYNTGTASPPADAPAGKVWLWTTFDILRLWTYYAISEDDPRLTSLNRTPFGTYRMFADEMLAWGRWQLGWLDPTQIRCLSELEHETTLTLSPVANPGNGTAIDRYSTVGHRNPSDRKQAQTRPRQKAGNRRCAYIHRRRFHHIRSTAHQSSR